MWLRWGPVLRYGFCCFWLGVEVKIGAKDKTLPERVVNGPATDSRKRGTRPGVLLSLKLVN